MVGIMYLQVWVILQKKIIDNRDTSQYTKHLTVPIRLCQKETILNLINLTLVYDLVSKYTDQNKFIPTIMF